MVIDELGVENSNCFILGDSISKDVEPAESIGAKGIWARYGEAVNQKNLETVLSISNWDDWKKDTIYFTKHKEPELIIDDFSDLKNILVHTQLSLEL
jgi:FMN phosphatase YigB (HAD superfamily)